MKKKKFEVYQLRASDEELGFYIGKTFTGSRRLAAHIAESKRKVGGYKSNKIFSVLHRGETVLYEVLGVFNSEEEALLEEVRLIKISGRRQDGSGFLVNITRGGEGTSGWSPTEVTRQRISEANLASKKFNDVWEPVSAFTISGEFIKVYPNGGRASIDLGFSTDIGSVYGVINGHLRYATNNRGIPFQFLRGIWLDEIPSVLLGRDKSGRIVLQYSSSGELVGRFCNISRAATSCGLDRSTVRSSILSPPKQVRTFYWRYEMEKPIDSKELEWRS